MYPTRTTSTTGTFPVPPALTLAPASAPAAAVAPAPRPVRPPWPLAVPYAEPAPAAPPEEAAARGDVPAARTQPASVLVLVPAPVPVPTGAAGAGGAVGAGASPSESGPALPVPPPELPHPHDASAHPAPAGVPGPGVAGTVARAVARGMEETQLLPLLPRGGPRTADGLAVGLRATGHLLTAPLPAGPFPAHPFPVRPLPVGPAHPGGPGARGSAVDEVPAHLPFRGRPAPPAAPAPVPAPARGAAPPAPRPVPGRRVPRGDGRLRERRGPVLPGWAAVAAGALALAGCAALLWRAGAVPAPLAAAFGVTPPAYRGLRATDWPPLALLGVTALLALGGLGRSRTGHAWVLTLFGRYRGTVRRTGLTWISPLLLRRRVDVRLRHWRSEPMPAVDCEGLALRVVVQVVWQVKDTARATLAVADHTEYLAEQVESAMARVLSQLPADAFHEDAPTLRDAEAVGDALTRMLAAETEAVGVEVFSAQPTRIEYAPEVAEAMCRRRVAAIDAGYRDAVLTSVVDAVDDTVHRLTSRGIVELDDHERKALVRDLTMAFCTGRAE
ncbi:SPFH domain-containing protein [Streptomyces sp. NPDC051567]|uniref:SPFH domain-containing protein n=1 Tax=Streptomyces sp. NPDC051567 TaxID=3365660 RepID=UPI0037B018A3